MTRRGGRHVLGLAAALFLGCAGCAPTPSMTSSVRPGQSDASPEVSSESLAPMDPASVEVHVLDARHVPADVTVSAAGEVLWTAGERFPSEIWRYVPGAPEPERVFASPRAESSITTVSASSAGYAFVEESTPAFGEGAWRLWYLSRPDGEPIEVARGLARFAGFAPTIAMDDRRIAWAGFDESVGTDPAAVQDHAVSRLAIASIDDLSGVHTLVERPVRLGLLWYPALHGDELWYSIIDPDSDPAALGPEYHVENIDIGNAVAAPARLRNSDHDFDAVANDHFVVWRANARGDSAFNWGTLHVLDRQSGDSLAISVEHANRPALGSRFVAFDEITHSRLLVYDLETAGLLDLAGRMGPGAWSFGGESISDRLLTFTAQDGTGRPRIGWAILPS